MGDIFGPEGIDDGSFDPDNGGEAEGGGIKATQTVNQNQGQGQNQQQQQQQPGFGTDDTLGIHQRATATNQNVVVGNTGAITTGPQTATAVNVAASLFGLASPSGTPITETATSVTYSVNASTGYTMQVITTPSFTLSIATPPGIGVLPTVTVA